LKRFKKNKPVYASRKKIRGGYGHYSFEKTMSLRTQKCRRLVVKTSARDRIVGIGNGKTELRTGSILKVWDTIQNRTKLFTNSNC